MNAIQKYVLVEDVQMSFDTKQGRLSRSRTLT